MSNDMRKLLGEARPCVTYSVNKWAERSCVITQKSFRFPSGAAPTKAQIDETLEKWKQMQQLASRIDAALAEKVEPVAHSDDVAVDKFSDAMKVKLAKKRAEGRGGWDDPSQCSIDYLIRLFHDHVAKGDPVDIGNFAMMLWNRMPATSLQEKYKRIPIYAAPADQWRRVEDGLPHTDHPMRHYDRTCPDCNTALPEGDK